MIQGIQHRVAWFFTATLTAFTGIAPIAPTSIALAQPSSPISPSPDQTIECEILILGGGLSGTAAAYEALRLGRTVC
ncbi:MAG TPA: hypothetical protein V6C65_09045, partial [Allocoleopsis sp.]